MPQAVNDRVLVGNATSDDAGVYLLSDDTALVQTVDFFTPIIDDPFQFGRIAAANSLSDVYAMNGRPITALNILAFPEFVLPIEMMADILRGGADIANEAGVAILGGHSVDDKEPKYGLAVTGVVDPKRIWRNVGAKPGDALVLSKPLGVGALVNAIRKGWASEDAAERVVAVTTSLNGLARDAAQGFTIHACTDVTGFGLLGHLKEMVEGSGVGARVFASRVPLMDGMLDAIEKGALPTAAKRNRAFVEPIARYDDAAPETLRAALCDTMTSGGLLFALPASEAPALVESLRAHGTPAAEIIGIFVNDAVEIHVTVDD